MAWTLAVVNQKGGVGKTTTTVNLATSLALAGKRVLVVDGDPQGNATSGLGISDKMGLEYTLYDTLINHIPLSRVILKNIAVSGLDLAPANLHLAGADMEMYRLMSRELILKQALKPVLPQYDFVLMDGPPSLSLLTINILTAADAMLIPIQCEYYALEGIEQLMTVMRDVRSHLNPNLAIGMVVLTMHDERVNLSRQVVQEVREFFQASVAQSIIPRNVRLSEAPSFGRPIELYDPKSKGALAYAALAQEIIALGKA